MDVFTKNMNNVLDITPTEEELATPTSTSKGDLVAANTVSPPPAVVTDQAFDDDFSQARESLKNAVKQGTEILGNLVAITRSAEHPMFFDATSKMLKSLGDISKDLIHIHKMKKIQGAAESEKDAPVGGINIERAVFTGSTTELDEIMGRRSSLLIKNPTENDSVQ